MAMRYLGGGVGHTDHSHTAEPERYATPTVEVSNCDLSSLYSGLFTNSNDVDQQELLSDSDSASLNLDVDLLGADKNLTEIDDDRSDMSEASIETEGSTSSFDSRTREPNSDNDESESEYE